AFEAVVPVVGGDVVVVKRGGGVAAGDDLVGGPERVGFEVRIGDDFPFAVGDEKQAAAGFAGCFRQIDREREGVGAARAVEGDRDESADGGAGERVLLGRYLEAERVGSADGRAAVNVFAEKIEQLGAAQVAPAFGGGDPRAVAGQQEVGQANACCGVGGSRLSGVGGGERHGESVR